MSTAYTSLCRSPKYLLKVRYIILNDPNVVRFLIFETLCLGRAKTLTYVWKKYHKNVPYLCFVAHSITKLSQNMCLINTHILMFQYARCNRKLWKVFWFYCVFWVFIELIVSAQSFIKFISPATTKNYISFFQTIN